jgi:hypothetical protein
VRHFEESRDFLKTFPKKYEKSEVFSNITRLFEDIFNGIEAFFK